jgi:hypothetical protein
MKPDFEKALDKALLREKKLEAEVERLKDKITGQEESDIFEIRIPNLRPSEIPIVRKEISNFTKNLLNALALRLVTHSYKQLQARQAKLEAEKMQLIKLLWDCHWIIMHNNKPKDAAELIVEKLNPEAIRRRPDQALTPPAKRRLKVDTDKKQDKELHKAIKKALLGPFETDPKKLMRMIRKVKTKQVLAQQALKK